MLPLRDILFLILFFGCLPFCFFRPFFGILMWTVVSLLNPHAFIWKMAHEFPWAMAVAIPTLIGAALFTRNWKNFFSRDVGLMVLLWVWFTFTTLYHTNQPVFAHFAHL